jgi:hypothetical protein
MCICKAVCRASGVVVGTFHFPTTTHLITAKVYIVMSDTETDPPTPTNAYEVTNLLSLPDELLLHVVHSLDKDERQESLCRLSLVNRRLTSVVRDEFYVSP